MATSKVILNGSTIMDVTQDTVTAGSMLSGTTAHKNDGTSITGSIASKTSSNLTASGLTVTAPAGYYASNATKTCTDANLLAENIKKDVTIFGVTGTHSGGTDTSDTTATAGDVVSGKYFYTSMGTKTAGTLASATNQSFGNIVTFNFTVREKSNSSISFEFTAIKGMTWTEFINSSYNPVYSGNNKVFYYYINGSYVGTTPMFRYSGGTYSQTTLHTSSTCTSSTTVEQGDSTVIQEQTYWFYDPTWG